MRLAGAMRSIHRRWAILSFAVTVYVIPSASNRALAQSTDEKASAPDAARAPAEKKNETLADRQAIIGDRVKRLEDRMFQLAQALKKSDPEKAQRLVEGLSALREDGLQQHIDEVVKLLNEHQLADAADAQVTLEDQMQTILKLLMEETNDLEKHREELKRLEEIRKELDALLNKQKEAKKKAERADAMKRVADALEDAATAARDLLERQQGLNADAGSGGDNAARPADAQAAIRGETEALSREVADLAEQLRAAGEGESGQAGARPSGEMPPGQTPEGDAPTPGGESKPGESGSPSGQGDAQDSKGSKSSPNAAGAQSPGMTPEKADSAKQHLDRAADAMQQAEETLRAAKDAGAEGDQATAESELKRAVENLRQQADDIRNRLKLDDARDAQRNVTKDSEKLLKDMKGESDEADSDGSEGGSDTDKSNGDKSDGEKSGGESGGSNQGGSQGQSGGDSQQGGSPQSPPASPGQRPLEEAIPHQQDATKNLEDNLPDDAVENQQKAIEKLEQAKEDLEERLDQLRREQQEQLLAALESRFRAMLSRQLEVNKSTNRLIDLGVDHWKRSDQLEMAELSEKQRWVGDQADEALFLLTEEGSTVVLPPLLEDVRDDARDVADRLAAARADREVRALQAELESVLRDMIDAVKKQQEELEQGGGGGGGGGSPPLLPGSAELKLLRSCQLRINTSTEKMHDELNTGSEDGDGLRAAIDRLATKQEKVAEMAKAMHESLQKAQ